MKVYELQNSLVKTCQQYLDSEGVTKITCEPLDCDKIVNVTSGDSLTLSNIYSINLIDRVVNKPITITFVCNAKKESHTYSHIESVTSNNRTYTSTKYHLKYTRLICELVYAMAKQFEYIN